MLRNFLIMGLAGIILMLMVAPISAKTYKNEAIFLQDWQRDGEIYGLPLGGQLQFNYGFYRYCDPQDGGYAGIHLNIGFSNKVHSFNVPCDKTYKYSDNINWRIPTNLTPRGDYNIIFYYHYRPNRSDLAAYYSVKSDNFVIGTLPQIVFPQDDSQNHELTLTLDWKDIPHADSYSVIIGHEDLGICFSCSSHINAIHDARNINASQYTMPVGVLEPNTTYRVIIAAKQWGKWFHSSADFKTGACSYSVTPNTFSHDSKAGNDSIIVNTATGCKWTAKSNASWAIITSGNGGQGKSMVNYSVTTNTSTQNRSGTLTIAGKTVTITQRGVSPTVSSVSPLTAKLNKLTTFTVKGNHLTATTAFSVDDCAGVTQFAGGTDTQRQFRCTPSGTAGIKDGIIKDKSGGTILFTFDVTVTQQPKLTVSKSGSGSGTITSSPTGINCGSDCSGSYTDGSDVTLTAKPASGSTFAGWSGASCSGTGTCRVSMVSNKSVAATFNKVVSSQKTLTISKSGSGSGTITSSPTGINCGSDCSESYTDGSNVTLTAKPASGSTFAGWSGACSGTGTCRVSMVSNKSVTATFNKVVSSQKTCRFINISTRAPIQGGAKDVIAGFIINGTGKLKIILRGFGLEAGVNPKLTLQKYPSGEFVASNDNWQNGLRAGEINALPLNLQLGKDTDAGLLLDLSSGAYTVILSSVGAKGLGLIGVDVIESEGQVPTAQLINISTRAPIQGGAYDVIAGFITKGSGTLKSLIRGWGLETGIDPKLLLQGYPSGDFVANNHNWQDSSNASEIVALPANLQLSKSTDAALLLALPCGTAHTVILSSENVKGLGLVGVDAVE